MRSITLTHPRPATTGAGHGDAGSKGDQNVHA